jgi:hypothetical protein
MSASRYSLLLVCCFFPALLLAQAPAPESPVPILTGNAGFFTNVQGGQTELVPEINPVVLVPVGDRWLIESRGEFIGDFERQYGDGPYGGSVYKQLDYLQADYIANPYVTVTVGRFLTPFGIYNERLYPIWIRSLQPVPLIFPLEGGSSNGAMLRGGFPLNAKVNLNYATYFSTLTTTNAIDSNRMAGGRVGFFLPGPRVEAGFSWQKLLQDERTNAFGFHFAWQPTPLPLNLRSEYARSNLGSGYWIEGAYRLSQVPFWRHAMSHTEFVARGQQFFAPQTEAYEYEYAQAEAKGSAQAREYESEQYELPYVNTRQADFGLNYYIRDGLKAVGSYSRQFSSYGNFNLWTVGIAYRFALPLGRVSQ